MAAKTRQTRRRATSDEHREKQLIAMATNLAERQLADGSASSQIITHFLKAGSSREKLELQRLRGEVRLNEAKIESLEASKRVDELYINALNAMRSYSGSPPPEEEEFYD